MKARYINELTEGARIDATFALRAKEMRAARTGDAYLTLDLADRTGSMPGVLFRPLQAALEVPVGSVVRIAGTVTSFRGAKRISVELMRPADNWDPDDILSACARSTNELKEEFAAIVRSVGEPGLRLLLKTVFGDSEYFERFARCPGAQSYHHAYLGGLMEHTVSVADHCSRIAPRYEGVDRDLLVTAALLHDVGKVEELSCHTGIGYTDEGRLIGHVVLGVRRVHEAGERCRIDPGTLVRVEHALLSHHGELEWGSPKRPSTIEALLLHHVDNLDAKAAGFANAVAGATHADEAWTDAGNLFRRPLYAPRAAEDDRHHRADEDGQHFRMTA